MSLWLNIKEKQQHQSQSDKKLFIRICTFKIQYKMDNVKNVDGMEQVSNDDIVAAPFH